MLDTWTASDGWLSTPNFLSIHSISTRISKSQIWMHGPVSESSDQLGKDLRTRSVVRKKGRKEGRKEAIHTRAIQKTPLALKIKALVGRPTDRLVGCSDWCYLRSPSQFALVWTPWRTPCMLLVRWTLTNPYFVPSKWEDELPPQGDLIGAANNLYKFTYVCCLHHSVGVYEHEACVLLVRQPTFMGFRISNRINITSIKSCWCADISYLCVYHSYSHYSTTLETTNELRVNQQNCCGHLIFNLS